MEIALWSFLALMSLIAFIMFITDHIDVTCMLVVIVAFSAFVFSLIPVSHTKYELAATATRVGDEIVIQPMGENTIIVDDIKFIDKPVKVIKTVGKNIYKCVLPTFISLEVQIKN